MSLFTWKSEQGWQARPLGWDEEPRLPAEPSAPRLVVGVDVGQVNDFTALVVDEVHEHEGGLRHHVRHIERLELQTPYPDQVEHVAARMAMPQLAGAELVVDRTGVGAGVYDLFRRAGLDPTGIMIHGGDAATREGGSWHVPKRDLVAAVQVALQSGRLKIAPGLAGARALTAELKAFEVKISAAGRDSYNAREGEHDDILLALACALWTAERGAGNTVNFF